ncbi:Regulator of nonsense transcripts 3A [Aphelenchoides avenae]|nr:Regulator of nonsense transcripts 3A [Aphelenchus avenae]
MELKKKKDERVPIKLVLRRLPYTITEEELREQLAPIPPHEAFWFCEADSELLPFSFARAYIALLEEDDAVSFRDRFNGYVFLDKQGNESMAICEMAPNQALPKRHQEDALKCDKRAEVEYLKFIEEYNNLKVQKVTNFDELIREAEERERQLKQGIVKDTPLTDFLMKQAMEKERKRAARSERHRGGWSKPDKGPAASAAKPKEEGREKEKKPRRERKPREDRPPKEPRGPKKLEKKHDKAADPKETGKEAKQPEERAAQKPTTSASGNVKPDTKAKPAERKLRDPESKGTVEESKTKPRPPQEKRSPGPAGDKSGKSEATDAKPARRLKDRPERAIYQPGRSRLGAAGAVKKDTSEPSDKPS